MWRACPLQCEEGALLVYREQAIEIGVGEVAHLLTDQLHASVGDHDVKTSATLATSACTAIAAPPSRSIAATVSVARFSLPE